MKKYTRTHLWFEKKDDRTDIGITPQGDDAMQGITFVEVVRNTCITVESTKSCEDIPNESTGGLLPYPLEFPLNLDKPVAYLPEGAVWKGELLDEEQYKAYCETL